MRVGIVGAGISGLSCAHALAEYGHRVDLYDKGRGPGGRMSRRRMDADGRGEGGAQLHFDHGAQYFTARDERFAKAVERWMAAGVVAAWEARLVSIDPDPATPGGAMTVPRGVGAPRFVGVPGMNEVVKHASSALPEGCAVTHGVRVTGLERCKSGSGSWEVFGGTDKGRAGVESVGSLGTYDAVAVALPSVQAAELLRDVPDMSARIGQARVRGCWALMLGFAESLGLGYEGAFVNVHAAPGEGLSGGALSWIGNNSSKPGRAGLGPAGSECWVAHASAEWSEAHMEEDKDAVRDALTAAFFQATGAEPRDTIAAAAHKWRYANVDVPLPDACLHDESLRLGACGDWCGGSRVEGAVLSGLSLAARLTGRSDDSVAKRLLAHA